MEQKWKNKVDQWTGVDQSAKQCMQNIEMYAPVFFRITWNAWHKNYSVVWNSHFRLVSTPIFYQFTNYYCFLLWKYLYKMGKHGLDWTLHLLCCIIHPLTIFGWGGSSSNSINMTGPMTLNARKSTTSSSSSSSSSSPLASKPVAISSPTRSAEPGFSSPPSVKKSEYRSYTTVTTLLCETQARLCFKKTKA